MRCIFLFLLILLPFTVITPIPGDLIRDNINYRNELETFIRCINSESHGESYLDKLRTGSVMLNRRAHPDFPKTLEDVICQPDQFHGVDSKYFVIDYDTEPGRMSIKAALYLMECGSILPNDVLYYLNPYKSKRKEWIKTLMPYLYIKGESHWFFKQPK